MIRLLTIIALSAFSCVAQAQKQRTIRYADGTTKLFEGRILFNSIQAEAISVSKTRESLRFDSYTALAPDMIGAPPSMEEVLARPYMDGLCKLYYEDGSVFMEQEFVQGVATGKFIMYYRDHAVKIKCSFKDGIADGPCTWYHKNGKPAFEGKFQAYTQDEVFRIISGELKRQHSVFTADVQTTPESSRLLQGSASVYLLHKEVFLLAHHSKLDGIYKFYDDNGRKTFEFSYSNGKADAAWLEWNTDGKLERRYVFEHGLVKSFTNEAGRTFDPGQYKAYKDSIQLAGMTTRPRAVLNDPDPQIVYDTVPPAVLAPSEYVDQMPEAPFDVVKYIHEHLEYPKAAKEENIEGRVVVSFVVKADGSFADFKVVRSLRNDCDEAAVTVLRSMPKWKPGKRGGKAVDVKWTQPVIFKLQ